MNNTDAPSGAITVEKSQRDPDEQPWFWLKGNTYPHRELLKAAGCRWSKKRRAWYYTGWALPQTVQQLLDGRNAVVQNGHRADVIADEHADVSSLEADPEILETRVNGSAVPDEASQAPKVRVIKPVLDVSDSDEPDAVVAAIRQTKAPDLPIPQPSRITPSVRRMPVRIPQQPCGELTGSISGSVWCYGWAVHEGICIYVNMGGPRMAVEAIRAKLAKGDIVNCVPWDAPAVELTAGEGNTGQYTDFMQNIPEARFTNLILLHDLVVQPNFGGKSTTFIFHISEEQAMARLRHHVTQLVKVPVFAAWTGYLWQAGQSAMLLRQTRTDGDARLWTVTLDADAWTRLLTGGLAERVIALPQQT